LTKILLINWRDRKNPEAGGAEIYYHEIFRRLVPKGFDITVLSHAYSGGSSFEDHDGIHVIRTGSRSLFNYAVIPFLLKHQNEYDLIIEDLNKIPFFTPLYVRRPRLHMVMHFFGKAIFQETDAASAAYVYLLERLVPIIYKKERFLAISDSTRNEIAAFAGHKDGIAVVEPGIDIGFFHSTLPKAPHPALVCISRLKKYKNVQFLIPALALIKKEIPDTELWLAGSGDYLDHLKSVAQSLGVEESVRFLGFVSEEKKRDILSQATLFVNPSIKEGWGITNIEANLCGTISLSSNVPGLRDSVQNGKTGMLFEFDNQDDFVAKAIELLRNNSVRRAMEQNALAYGKSFAWDVMAGKMETVIRAAL
jgi:glycosyltransferase involved in cell wall biosynthesis